MSSRKFLPIYRGRNYYFRVRPSPVAVTQERGIKIIKTQIYTVETGGVCMWGGFAAAACTELCFYF